MLRGAFSVLAVIVIMWGWTRGRTGGRTGGRMRGMIEVSLPSDYKAGSVTKAPSATNIITVIVILNSNILVNRIYSILFYAVIYLGNSSRLYKNM